MSVAPDVDVPLIALASVETDQPAQRVVARAADDIVTAAFEQYHHEIFSFLARTLRDDTEAEDLLQETFVRLANQVHAGRSPDQLRAWLYRVAANLATSRFRRGAVARRWLDRFGAAEQRSSIDASPESGFLGRERNSELERALGVIPTDARTALLMAAQGFSGREIAAALGRSEVATRALMCRARLRLRSELERDEP